MFYIAEYLSHWWEDSGGGSMEKTVPEVHQKSKPVLSGGYFEGKEFSSPTNFFRTDTSFYESFP